MVTGKKPWLEGMNLNSSNRHQDRSKISIFFAPFLGQVRQVFGTGSDVWAHYKQIGRFQPEQHVSFAVLLSKDRRPQAFDLEEIPLAKALPKVKGMVVPWDILEYPGWIRVFIHTVNYLGMRLETKVGMIEVKPQELRLFDLVPCWRVFKATRPRYLQTRGFPKALPRARAQLRWPKCMDVWASFGPSILTKVWLLEQADDHCCPKKNPERVFLKVESFVEQITNRSSEGRTWWFSSSTFRAMRLTISWGQGFGFLDVPTINGRPGGTVYLHRTGLIFGKSVFGLDPKHERPAKSWAEEQFGTIWWGIHCEVYRLHPRGQESGQKSWRGFRRGSGGVFGKDCSRRFAPKRHDASWRWQQWLPQPWP